MADTDHPRLRYALLPTDGPPIVDTRPWHLEALQAAVGGHIEAVALHTVYGPCTMYVNEEGKLFGLPANGIASAILRGWSERDPADWIAGPAVIVGNNGGPHDTNLPDGVVAWLQNL